VKYASVVPAARILVVEDNASDVFLLERALNQQNFRFELVHLLNGDEALAFIRRQGVYEYAAIPNLILVDLNLSKFTGEDILREIRGASHLGGIPVCVWSSSRSGRDEALFKDLGVSRFITKPSGLDQFMEIGRLIKDLLAGPSASWRRLGAPPASLQDRDSATISVSQLAARGSEGAPVPVPAQDWHVTCYVRAYPFQLTPVRRGEKGNGGVWQRRAAVVGQAGSRVLRMGVTHAAQGGERFQPRRSPQRT